MITFLEELLSANFRYVEGFFSFSSSREQCIMRTQADYARLPNQSTWSTNLDYLFFSCLMGLLKLSVHFL